jgi:hypothetical protein
MAMIKRAKTGQIKEMIDNTTEQVVEPDLNLRWADVQIKDVLDVPTNSSHVLDVDLDEEDGDEIAVKV